jgi:hypothetical protein
MPLRSISPYSPNRGFHAQRPSGSGNCRTMHNNDIARAKLLGVQTVEHCKSVCCYKAASHSSDTLPRVAHARGDALLQCAGDSCARVHTRTIEGCNVIIWSIICSYNALWAASKEVPTGKTPGQCCIRT